MIKILIVEDELPISKLIEMNLTDAGYTVTRYAFTDTNDVTSVAQTAADASDVIYIPTDNTAASNTEAIANVVLPAKVPVVAGEEGICKGCGVATLSISYYDLGYQTGTMAYQILAEGADISTMPVEYAPNVTKKYNAANCEALGITPPDGYEAISEYFIQVPTAGKGPAPFPSCFGAFIYISWMEERFPWSF